jgi:hypothetical protein
MYQHVQVSKGQQRAQVSSSAFPAAAATLSRALN